MEQEVCGTYVSSIRTKGKLFAVFSKELIGDNTLTMYEVEDAADRQPSEYGFKRARSLPTLKDDPIPVYKTNNIPWDKSDIERFLTEGRCDDDCTLQDANLQVSSEGEITKVEACEWEPARQLEVLGSASAISQPWHIPETPVGVLETSWTFRTAMTPPPYTRLDNRRRSTAVAYLNPANLQPDTPESPIPRSNSPWPPTIPSSSSWFPTSLLSPPAASSLTSTRRTEIPEIPEIPDRARLAILEERRARAIRDLAKRESRPRR